MAARHAFLENIALAAEVSPVQLLTGARIADRLVLQQPGADGSPGGARVLGLNSAIIQTLGAQFDAILVYDSLGQAVQLASGKEVPWLGVGEGKQTTMTLDQLLDRVPLEAELASLLLVEDGDFLFEAPAVPRDGDLALLHRLNRHCERALKTPAGKNVLTVVLKFRNGGRIPALLTANPLVRQVYLGVAGRDERAAYARLALNRMPEGLRTAEAAEKLVAVSESLQIEELNSIVELAAGKAQSLTDIEHIARGVRIGVTDSPWAGGDLREALKRAPETIGRRVKGQSHVIAPTISFLKRAALNLSGAHTRATQAPRLVLWLSGPTGTGKTELAKTVAELIFGDENALVRFDCAEFADAHSDARLIGSPPGYVGHESGGELTEAVRERPFSVILLDEIEKAHPRILDKFLAILDDGRLTDGQGRTVNFSETVVIFSSNLGMNGGRGYSIATSFEELERGVRDAVKEHFLRQLGRPELLGRIGLENIFVFDFIRQEIGAEILDKMVGQIVQRVEENTGVRILVTEAARHDLHGLCLQEEVLTLGGRGIAKKLEAVLTTRLAETLYEMIDRGERECRLVSVSEQGVTLQ